MQLTYSVGVNSPTNIWQLVQDYCVTSETLFVTDIPTFVQAAEERIYNDANLPILRNNVTGALTVGNKYLSTPSGWLATYSLALFPPNGSTQSFLLDKDVNFIREAYPDPTYLAQPVHYAQFDSNTIIVGPTPDQAYQLEMHYKAYPASITTATNTWIGTNFGDLLLYGTLREAYTFQKGEADMMAKYEALYQESLMQLKKLVDGANRQDFYRNVQPRAVAQ